MITDKLPEQVLRVCRDHLESAPTTERILWFPPVEVGQPIRLLEVDPLTLPSDSVWVMSWAADDDYPAVWIAVVTPDEWQRVRDGSAGWELPSTWNLSEAVEVPLDPLRKAA